MNLLNTKEEISLMELEWGETQLFHFVKLRKCRFGKVRNSKLNSLHLSITAKIQLMGMQISIAFHGSFDFTPL